MKIVFAGYYILASVSGVAGIIHGRTHACDSFGRTCFVRIISFVPLKRGAPYGREHVASTCRNLSTCRLLAHVVVGEGPERQRPLLCCCDKTENPGVAFPCLFVTLWWLVSVEYTPQKIDIEFKLQPFVPEYVPGVGDADAFLKVNTPANDPRGTALSERVHEHIDNLGLTVLDEPSAEQSDSALLHLQLRAISKTNSAKSTVLAKKIENAEKNGKAIERWIKDVSELHLSKPAPTVTYTNKMPDIDSLMEEWPEAVEETLNSVGFPPAALSCSLPEYAALLCGLFDIPTCGDTPADRIQALHLLFSLYSAVRGSQLYAERLREAEGTGD